MVQKTTWMRYLTLGTIFSALLIHISCKKEYFGYGHFYFVNETNHSITYGNLFEEYNLGPHQTILIKQTQDATRRANLEDYISPFSMRTKGPLDIRFDANKCVTVLRETEHSVLNIESYKPEKLDKFTYKFTYTFTEADYNRALTCP